MRCCLKYLILAIFSLFGCGARVISGMSVCADFRCLLSQMTEEENRQQKKDDLSCQPVFWSFSENSSVDSVKEILQKRYFLSTENGNQFTEQKALLCLQIGTCLMMTKNYPEAMVWFRKCLMTNDGKGVVAVDAYQNIAGVHYFQGDYESAILNYQKAWLENLELERKDPFRLFQTLASLGSAYIENHEEDKGLACLTNAESLLNQMNADSIATAGLNINLGTLYLSIRKPRSALGCYLKGLKFLGRIRPSTGNATILAIRGTAQSYLELDRSDSSSFFLKKALSEITSNGNDLKPELPGVFLLTGDVFMKRQEYDSAQWYYKNAFHQVFQGWDPSDTCSEMLLPSLTGDIEQLRVLERYANIYLLQGILKRNDSTLLKQSYRYFQFSIQVCKRIRQQLFQESSRLVFNDDEKKLYSGAIEAAYRLWKSGVPGYRELLWNMAADAKGSILETRIKERAILEMESDQDSNVVKQKKIKTMIGTISRKKYSLVNMQDSRHWLSFLNDLNTMVDLKTEMDSLTKKMDIRFQSSVNQWGLNDRVSSVQSQESTGFNEALLKYYCADSVFYLFVVTNDTFDVRRIVPPPDILTKIQDFNRSIRTADSRNFSKISNQLYKILVEPVMDFLSKKNHLIIIPDEKVTAIPFEALVTGERRGIGKTTLPEISYLIDKFEISYHFSEFSFIETRNRKWEGRYNFLGVAPGLTDGLQDHYSYDPLHFSLPEVNTIGDLFRNGNHDAQAITDKAAAKCQVLHSPGGYSHLHFATHSTHEENHPEFAGLVIGSGDSSGEKSPEEDEILWRDEIEQIGLHADLVVLSACRTGKGKLTRTEGVVGLPWSFFIAGASNILYTMWNIPDHHAFNFMTDFYGRFLSGKSYSAALRETKLKMIRQPVTSQPYLWAGFVLLGK